MVPGPTVAQELDMSLDDIIESTTRDVQAGKAVRNRREERAASRQHSSSPYSRSNQQSSRRQPEGSRRHERGDRVRGAAESQYDECGFPSDFIRVSSNSPVKLVAGKIAHNSRNDQPPRVMAIGHDSLNQAVKAVAIARKYCSDPPPGQAECFDLTCQPAFRDEGALEKNAKPSLALYLAKRRISDRQPSPNGMELTVGSNSEPSTVAGALAARVRESRDVCLTAIGIDAVAIAIRAVCFARLYLQNDHLDIKCQPEFMKVKKASHELSGLRFIILVEDTY